MKKAVLSAFVTLTTVVPGVAMADPASSPPPPPPPPPPPIIYACMPNAATGEMDCVEIPAPHDEGPI